MILEPVQGEGGVVVPPPGYLREVADLCTENDALLIVDEIQTGMGRLGTWWGIEAEQVVPDILLVGKGLSGGVVPIAAMVATPRAYAPFAKDPYLHTSTFAGSPLACAAATATIGVIHDEQHRRPRGPHRGAAPAGDAHRVRRSATGRSGRGPRARAVARHRVRAPWGSG